MGDSGAATLGVKHRWHALGGRLTVKRIVDLVLGTALAVLATPLILVLAIASCACHGAWPFFTQTRVGQYGRPFTLVKIRTMPRSAPPYRLKTEHEVSALPSLCRLLRRTRLDELPQLWLVPLGRMSLVGPRPKMPDEFEPVDPTYNYVRTRVPQGCTGLWQISEHRTGLPHDAPEYAFHYVTHGGFRLDLWVLLRTLPIMLGVARPTTLDQVPAWTRGPGWVTADSWEMD
jgi:lipopolysaccharide/colanic/teichoic acid biosynthesis glycosyltransferase